MKKYCRIIKKVVEFVIKSCYDFFRIENSCEVNDMDSMKLTVFDVADFFRSKESMTHKKLQKLVYYAYAWYIALNNESKDNINVKIFNADFEAWIHGPVCPELYHKYSNNYGFVDKFSGGINSLIDGEIKKFLEKIYKIFGKYTGDELESMTHQEMPWLKARENLAPYEPSHKRILESDMFIYYNSLK